ncbi:hypothetical protein R3W88_014413 [Solanum pinnatisectum]|uniref:Uncharacterized protein n=1 Tax=Solanum pinnatisectum TaxID=50273 RepID=A0AAV9KUL9_9SOLN|nr:hypothetical protein R3W88_014413 [Solanum pinnatisectum]
MDSSIVNEIYVFPQICNAKRGPVGSSISGGTYKYESLSWDIFDKDISTFDFPSPLEKFKWDGADKILERNDDLIQKILEFVRTLENITPPFQDEDSVCVILIFVKKVFVPPQEFELTKMNMFFHHYENFAAILWNKVRNEIKRY